MIQKDWHFNTKTNYFKIFGFLLICISFLSIITVISFAEISKDKSLYGVSYSPLRQNQSPYSQVHPSIADIENDIKYLSSITKRLRIYDISGNNQFIPLIAEKYDIKLTVGLPLSNDDQKNIKVIDALVKIANRHDNTIETIVVGNDILAKKIMNEYRLTEYIHMIRNKLDSDNVKVTISESWELWQQHSSLMDEVDHVTIHIYPYYESLNVDDSALYVIGVYKKFQDSLKQSQKEVIIGETGWPSDGKILGNAVASPENQRKFIEEFKTLANFWGIKYYFFEAFDENWKAPVLGSSAEQNFGLFYENGTIKEALIGLMPELHHHTTRNNMYNESLDLDDAIWLSNYLEENPSSNLPWILNLTSLWRDESITNIEFLNAVHYLIKSDIIKI